MKTDLIYEIIILCMEIIGTISYITNFCKGISARNKFLFVGIQKDFSYLYFTDLLNKTGGHFQKYFAH